MGTVPLPLLFWISFLSTNAVAQILGGLIREPYGTPYGYNIMRSLPVMDRPIMQSMPVMNRPIMQSLPVINQPIMQSLPVINRPAVPNMLANLNLPFRTNMPIDIAQLANAGMAVNYGYGQNLQINNLPFNSLPINQVVKTRSPKIVLVKFNIPVVKRMPEPNLPLYNNLQYALGNNLKVTNLPLNTQLVNNLPLNTVQREIIRPSYNYVQQRLPLIANNRAVTNVPVVPLNRLSNLPTYNGMPVVKVKQTLYKML